MIKFLTISDRDSKDAINVFYNILNDIISTKFIDKNKIYAYMEGKLVSSAITTESLKKALISTDFYSQKRELSIPFLALWESTTKVEKKYKTSYDEAYDLFKNFNEVYSLDHLLVQNPNKDDKHFKYYNNDNMLVLKDGNDFPSDLVYAGMGYDDFKSIILNRIGNLRIYYKDKNSARSNNVTSLKEYYNFYTYSDIMKRGNEIADLIFEIIMPSNTDKIKFKITESNRDNTKKQLNMSELIEKGLIKKGDKVYLTVKPKDSVATLLNDKFVDYNSKKMRINEWGCSVTGWKAIRIYEYMAIVGEKETLQDKRERYARIN